MAQTKAEGLVPGVINIKFQQSALHANTLDLNPQDIVESELRNLLSGRGFNRGEKIFRHFEARDTLATSRVTKEPVTLIDLSGWYTIRVADSVNTLRFAELLMKLPGVDAASPEFLMNNRVNSVANFSPPAPPPSPPSVSINTSGFSPELNWGSVSGATSYKVYTGTVAGAPGTVNCNSVSSFSLLDTTTSTSYTDYSVIIDPYESLYVCYYVTSVNSTGESNPSNKVGTHAMAPLKEIADRQIPDEYSLFQNYPNPFNPSTTFTFGLPEQAHVSLKVYNITGQLVATLMSDPMSAGYHEVNWQADRLPSGIYILQMQAVGVSGETHRFMQKLTLLK